MKPITELTIGHVGKTIRVTDDGMDITGTLDHLEVNVDTETIYVGLERRVSRRTHHFEITLHISGNTIRATLDAQWEKCERLEGTRC